MTRRVAVFVVLTLLLVAVVVATLTLGRLGLDLTDLPGVLTGDLKGRDRLVFHSLRGPRLAVALLAGAAFGLAGSLSQTATGNALGSPDIIGVTAGAGAGAAWASLSWPTLPMGFGALGGAVIAMGVVWFSTGSGFRRAIPMVLAGIGVAAMAGAFTQYVVAVKLRDHATGLAGYLAGTLNSRSWSHVVVVLAVLVATAPLLWMLDERLNLLGVGEELCDALGGRAQQTRSLALLLVVVLSSASVAAAGPIAFIALTAPHVARGLLRRGGTQLVASGLVGALLLSLSDLAAQHAPMLKSLPVGVITAGVGGAYLAHLLQATWRKEAV